jgi:hypothetical protein
VSLTSATTYRSFSITEILIPAGITVTQAESARLLSQHELASQQQVTAGDLDDRVSTGGEHCGGADAFVIDVCSTSRSPPRLKLANLALTEEDETGRESNTWPS